MSPRSSKQFQEIREEKMTLIMDVALKHFAAEGYFSTTISHISKHAGIAKGLMYNYFESKEELLEAIIRRSIAEVYGHLDVNRDGHLSEEEFEFFIRKLGVLLREKQDFWRLLTQLLMQEEARREFLKSFPGPGASVDSGIETEDNYLPQVFRMFSSYFQGKKGIMEEDYDPVAELEMFMITLKGYAVKVIFSDEYDESMDQRIIGRIIRQFK